MWVIYPQRRNNFNKSDAEEYRLSPVMASPWVSVWILRPLGDKITQNQVVWLEATGRGNGSGDVGGVTWPWTGTVCVWCWVVFLLCIKSSLVKLCLNRSPLAFPGRQLDGNGLMWGSFLWWGYTKVLLGVYSSICNWNWFFRRLSKQKWSRNTLIFKKQSKY